MATSFGGGMSEKIYTVIVGAGSYLPARIVGNKEFIDREFYEAPGRPCDPAKSGATVKKFEEITRIAERRYVGDDLVTSDIALLAARDALAKTGADKESLDYLIVAHNFGDVAAENRRSDFVPSIAARVKQKLEIRNPRCIAYDLPFGCAGWLQGVIQTDYYFRSGDAKRAMVIGAETLSRVSDPHDRDSMLYADGAGCAILEARSSSQPVGILAHSTRSDTLDHAALMWLGASFKPQGDDAPLFLKMRGRKLYEYAVKHVPYVVKESLDKAGLRLRDVNRILMHQANAKMNDAILRHLFDLKEDGEVPPDVMPMTIAFLGNSSVATLPTLLDLIEQGKIECKPITSGDLVVLAAVGAGMNINSVVYRWP
jgi:3-oxoacyl-[acyl-carrier-protein] synthase-3